MKSITLLALLALGACTTSPVSVNEAKAVTPLAYQAAPNEPYATVTVVRDSGFEGSACSLGLFVDGKVSAILDTSQKATLYIPVGEHIVGASSVGAGLCGAFTSNIIREISAMFKGGEMRQYRMGVSTSGDIILQPTAF